MFPMLILAFPYSVPLFLILHVLGYLITHRCLKNMPLSLCNVFLPHRTLDAWCHYLHPVLITCMDNIFITISIPI